MGKLLGVVIAKSQWLENEALVHPEWPLENPPPYLNGIIALESDAEPATVLETLFQIERELGRSREKETVRWGPRIIDLDIIACDELVVQSEVLLVPHPEMHKRRFVLEPMLEVAPNWRHPILGKNTSELIAALRK